jgi:hypothetical protein
MGTIQIGPGTLTVGGQTIQITGAQMLSISGGPPARPPMIREIVFSANFTRRMPDRRLRKAMRKLAAEWERQRRVESKCGVLVRRFPESRHC